MEIPRVEPCRLPGASGLHKSAGTQTLHQDPSLSGEGAGSSSAPGVEVFLPVGVDCLVQQGFRRLWFLALNPAVHSAFAPVMSAVTATLSFSNQCSFTPVPPTHPQPTLAFSFPGAKPRKTEAFQTAEAELLCSSAAQGWWTVLLSWGPTSLFLSGGSAVGGEGRLLMARQQGTSDNSLDLCHP